MMQEVLFNQSMSKEGLTFLRPLLWRILWKILWPFYLLNPYFDKNWMGCQLSFQKVVSKSEEERKLEIIKAVVMINNTVFIK